MRRRRCWLLLLLVLVVGGCAAARDGNRVGPMGIGQEQVTFLPQVMTLAAGWEKRGLGSDTELQMCGDVAQYNCTWWHNWSPNAEMPEHQACGEFIPMLFSDGHQGVIPDPASTLLVLNEPDCIEQANMTPDEAAVFVWWVAQTYGADYALVGPVVTDRPEGWEWMQAFGAAYWSRFGRWPEVDALGVHCYLGSAEACITHTERYIDLATFWGMDGVWVTEWQMPSIAEAQEFRSWLDGEPKVLRWAYFAGRSSWGDTSRHLVDQQGMETVYGRWFRTLPVE